jgi:hypothetical protein
LNGCSPSSKVHSSTLYPFEDHFPAHTALYAVYRDLQKSNRKSGAAGASAKGKATESHPSAQPHELMGPPQSMPNPKSKGKEKAKAAAKLPPDDDVRENSPLEGQDMDVDADADADAEMVDGEQPEDEVVEEFDLGEDLPEEESEDEEEQEQEQEQEQELVDQEAVVEDELNRDNQDLDQYDAPDSEA